MKILVAIKQVLDPESVIQASEDGRWISAGPKPLYQLNRFDEYALEEAIRIKQAHPGVQAEVVSVGPGRVRSVLERALGMGMDRAIHLIAPDDGYLGPDRVAAGLAALIRERGYDLILTGAISEDYMQGQVGPMTAAMAGLVSATGVMRVEADPEAGLVRVERETEGGRRQGLELRLPALLAVQTGINQPRYPTLSGLLRAKKAVPDTYSLEEIAPGKSLLEVVRVRKPEKSRQARMLDGSLEEKAEALARVLRERSLL